MKRLQTVLSIVLALIMVFSVIPMTGITAFAITSGDFEYKVISETDKTCEISNYTGTAADLIIPSKLDGYTITRIREYTFGNCTSLISVTLPDSVTRIEDFTFQGCTSLANITLPNSVTYIGNFSFRYCKSLTSITIPDGVTSIANSTFQGCTSLTDITIPDSVTRIYAYAFQDCVSLTSITIPNGVTSIATSAFQGCTSLTDITIPNSITSIDDCAFYGCTSLTNIMIPDSVTSMGGKAFVDTAYYNNVNHWENDVLYIGHHLINAKGTIRGSYTVKTGTITVAGDAFKECVSLTSIIIPNSVTSIGHSAFKGCTALKNIKISNKVTNIGSYAFENCTSLTSITIPNGVTSIGSYAFWKCTSLTSIIIPNSITGIGVAVFGYCTSLINITIPNSITSIDDYAFNGCTSLKDVYYSGSEEDWKKILIGNYNKNLKNATIHYNSKMPPSLIGKQLRFENEVYFMNVNDTKEVKAYICDAYYDNGKIVYENKEPIDSSRLLWSTNGGEENKLIRIDQTGRVIALSEGLTYLSAYGKDDTQLFANCWIYVGKPNAFAYSTVYDTKQYYAAGGFYSQTSSISDCVELYCSLENKITDELQIIVDKLPLNDLSTVSPITLTATVSGKDLSFSRDSYQNTYTATFDSISAGKTVDDILMLFPHNLSLSPSGNTYTVTVTLESDSFDTVTEKYTFAVENLANKGANEHISFVSSNAAYRDSKDNRYGQQMVTLKNDVEYKWSKYSSLDFENYYEVVFADVLVGLIDTAQLEHVSLLPVVKEWVGNYKTVLSSVSTMVEDDYTGYLDVSENAIDKLLKKSKYTTKGIHTDDELYQTVVDLLGNTGNAEKITKAFATIDKTKQYYSFFKLGVNITNDIVDFVNGASVLNSYKDMDDEFKAVVNNLYNQIPNSEKKLKDAVYHYVNVDSYLGYSEELFNAVRDMAGDITLDIFKSIYKKRVVSSLCKVIGNITLKSGVLLSSTSAFSGVSTALGAFTTGWTLGTCVSDILCNNSGKSAEMSKVIAMSEFSPYIINTLNHYESKLYSDRDNTAVAEFEYAFAMHKATQSYIMARTVRSLEMKRDSLIIKLFSRDDYDGLISDILADKQSIENLKCHTDDNTATVVSQTKVVAIKCPVDVFIYDTNGNEVVRIVNNIKEYVASGLSVCVGNNEKYIALPANQNYQIKIVATDQGTMEYFVTEYDNGVQRKRTVETVNIPLRAQRVFTGEVAKEMDVAPESYALSYENERLLPDNIVEVPILGVLLDINALSLSVGESSRLTATVMPANVTNAKVRWYSDDPSIAVVDENGIVTTVAAGKTTIWVVTEDWGYMAACTVTVTPNSLMGDLNGDGIINAIDARWTLQAASGARNLTDEQHLVADVNKDGVVNAIDARWILQIASGARKL